MNATNIQSFPTKKEIRQQLKQQIADYLAAQPESMQKFHRWMKVLDTAGVALIAAAFILAMYVSINWTAVQQPFIPVAWFLFAASVTPTMILVGIQAIVLRAFPPVLMPGKTQAFVTGSKAIWYGVGIILVSLITAAFWGLFAYATWTHNFAMLAPLIRILGTVMGYGIVASILLGMAQKIIKSRL